MQNTFIIYHKFHYSVIVSVSDIKKCFFYLNGIDAGAIQAVLRVQRISLDDGCHFKTTAMHEVRFRLKHGELLQIVAFLKFSN